MSADMNDTSERLMQALEDWERVADSATPDDAARALDQTTLQLFWQRWPQISAWGGALWRRLNDDMADAARSVDDPGPNEVGGEGG
jgi:hypothetical protein